LPDSITATVSRYPMINQVTALATELKQRFTCKGSG